MNGLHRSSLLFLRLLLLVIPVCPSLETDYARYRYGRIADNHNGCRKIAGARIQVTGHPVTGFFQRNSLFTSTALRLKPGKNEISLPALPEPDHDNPSVYRIRNCKRKTAVIRHIMV